MLLVLCLLVVTLHASRVKRSALMSKNGFESYFNDRLTLSNIHSRTSRRIYRLALPLHTPEKLSSLSKSRFPYLMCTLLYFSEGYHNYGHTIPSKSTAVAIGRPDKKQNHCRTGERECEELCLRIGSPLASGVMCFVSSSLLFQGHNHILIRKK